MNPLLGCLGYTFRSIQGKHLVINKAEKLVSKNSIDFNAKRLNFLRIDIHMTQYFNDSENPTAAQVFFDIIEHQ